MRLFELFLLLQSITGASVTPTTNFQVIAGYSGSNTCYTIFSGQSGWAAIGIGSSSMSGADVYIGWKNSTSGITLANLKSTGHSQPGVNSVQNAWLVPLLSTAPTWSKLSFSFCRPTAISSGAAITSSVPYIYASCSTVPSTPNSISSRFSQHQSIYGSFNIDATSTNLGVSSSGTGTNTSGTGSSPTTVSNANPSNTPNGNNPGTTNGGGSSPGNNPNGAPNGVSTGSGSNQAILIAPDYFPYSNIVALHGCIMLFAWSVCPTLAIFTARYLKNIGHTWFITHMWLGIATAVCTATSFLLIFLYYTPPHFASYDFLVGSHTRWGLAVLVGMIAQIVLGVISDRMWDVAHWWFGRVLYCLANLNVFSGLALYSTDFGLDGTFITLYWVFVFVVVALFIYGETRLGQVHHIEGKTGTIGASRDTV
ncbi:hypothetical protein HDV06_000472 [Boothiomyces sp. JEL0866]|nr:hypothetical protein HDV06_000472 [Boothiomyces sp. JEL0866]